MPRGIHVGVVADPGGNRWAITWWPSDDLAECQRARTGRPEGWDPLATKTRAELEAMEGAPRGLRASPGGRLPKGRRGGESSSDGPRRGALPGSAFRLRVHLRDPGRDL